MNDSREIIYFEKPLSDARDVRIVEIQPAEDFDSPICCTLRVISLDTTKEKYQGLSYAWESPVKSKTIICDGKSLGVTATLDLALRRIREKIYPKDIFYPAIWIDAICINQDDDLEKSKQVTMMGEIYGKSSRLIIWLGEASSDEVNETKEALKIPPGPRSNEILHALTHRPWFGRLWVIQEVFKSPRACRHVLLRNFRFKFDTLVASCTRAQILEHSGAVLHIFTPALRTGWVSLESSSKHPYSPLLGNMVRLRNAEASQAYDRVYALLSISDPRSTVPVDYQTKLESVYLNLARKHIASSNQIRHLLMCAITFCVGQSRSAGLPSWVPDWRILETLIRSHPQRLETLEFDMEPSEIFLAEQIWDAAAVDEQNGLAIRGIDANPFETETLGSHALGHHCSYCGERRSCITIWLNRQGRLTDVQNGKAIVLRFAERTVFLITHDQSSDGHTNTILDSYCELPTELRHRCPEHPGKQRLLRIQ